jgi:hypothetical protein
MLRLSEVTGRSSADGVSKEAMSRVSGVSKAGADACSHALGICGSRQFLRTAEKYDTTTGIVAVQNSIRHNNRANDTRPTGGTDG